ncbi:MAG: hypothetical protein VZR73_18630, partial [Acutalibacteraceae bacterium]|nr:hypothetical protein [Acutalibacteraceae bacterium]
VMTGIAQVSKAEAVIVENILFVFSLKFIKSSTPKIKQIGNYKDRRNSRTIKYSCSPDLSLTILFWNYINLSERIVQIVRTVSIT